MEQHINYITLGVGDLAISRRFYQDIFGWQETVDSNENIAFFETGSALRFALFGKEALAQDAQVLVQGSGFHVLRWRIMSAAKLKWMHCFLSSPQKM